MPPRLPRRLTLALLLAACGDNGETSAGATTITTAVATTTNTMTGPGTGPSAGEPTTGATTQADPTTGATDSAGTTDAASSTTTGGPGTTTTASSTAGSSSTSTSGTSDTDSSDTDSSSTGEPDTTGGPVCGDGVVEPGETCDDGSGVGCDSHHDGGDGVCVPPGTCSPGYVLAGDDCVAELWTEHVHILVDNFCNMQVMPSAFTVQPGQKLRLDYHNHSADYAVDVWMHYNGGFTDLPPGATWMEQYEHCFGPNPSEGWAEISTACSQFVLPITCL